METGETTDEMLSDMQCPGRAVTVLDVSLDTRDSGRGINSRVSEKPTRALVVALGGLGLGGMESLKPWAEAAGVGGSWTGSGSAVSIAGSSASGIVVLIPRSKLVGLLGALLPLGVQSMTGGCRIGKSFVEMAPDMPLLWPRRGGGGCSD